MAVESLKRSTNWPSLLSQYLNDAKDFKFAWGSNDCCFFAANLIKRLTDVDVLSDIRGKYSTRAGAFKVLKEVYAGDIQNAPTKHLGESIHYNFLKRGDIALYDSEQIENPSIIVEMPCLGIVTDSGTTVALLTPDKGYLQIPLKQAVKGWAY